MIDFKQIITEIISEKIDEIKKEKIYCLIEIPPDENMGDLAVPCFQFAKILKKSPTLIAEELINKIEDNKYFSKIKNNGPYINFFINNKIMAKEVL